MDKLLTDHERKYISDQGDKWIACDKLPSNAVLFTSRGGSVTVRTTTQNKHSPRVEKLKRGLIDFAVCPPKVTFEERKIYASPDADKVMDTQQVCVIKWDCSTQSA